MTSSKSDPQLVEHNGFVIRVERQRQGRYSALCSWVPTANPRRGNLAKTGDSADEAAGKIKAFLDERLREHPGSIRGIEEGGEMQTSGEFDRLVKEWAK